MNKKEESKFKGKSLNELKNLRDDLQLQIKEYLLVLGADYFLLKEIMDDLKKKKCVHADTNVNLMIEELVQLEKAIAIAKDEEEKKQSQPNQ